MDDAHAHRATFLPDGEVPWCGPMPAISPCPQTPSPSRTAETRGNRKARRRRHTPGRAARPPNMPRTGTSAPRPRPQNWSFCVLSGTRAELIIRRTNSAVRSQAMPGAGSRSATAAGRRPVRKYPPLWRSWESPRLNPLTVHNWLICLGPQRGSGLRRHTMRESRRWSVDSLSHKRHG